MVVVLMDKKPFGFKELTAEMLPEDPCGFLCRKETENDI